MRDRFPATASPKRLAAAALGIAVLSSVAIAGASTTPVPKGHAVLKPVPAGKKVHTVSAKRATAKFNSRRMRVAARPSPSGSRRS